MTCHAHGEYSPIHTADKSFNGSTSVACAQRLPQKGKRALRRYDDGKVRESYVGEVIALQIGEKSSKKSYAISTTSEYVTIILPLGRLLWERKT